MGLQLGQLNALQYVLINHEQMGHELKVNGFEQRGLYFQTCPYIFRRNGAAKRGAFADLGSGLP